jgi:hypothetical protein
MVQARARPNTAGSRRAVIDVRLAHIAEMSLLMGGEMHGDLRPRSVSRLAIPPNTTHVTLMQRIEVIAPMINEFLDTRPDA